MPNCCQIFNKNFNQQLIQWYIKKIQFWHILTEWSILGKTRLLISFFVDNVIYSKPAVVILFPCHANFTLISRCIPFYIFADNQFSLQSGGLFLILEQITSDLLDSMNFTHHRLDMLRYKTPVTSRVFPDEIL